MKNYTFKNILSMICFIITGFCASIALICITAWCEVVCAIICGAISVYYCITGIAFKKNANKDYKYYLSQQEFIQKTYTELSYMYKKYYWILDVDSLVPSLKNKKNLLMWAVDTAVACQAYQYDYNTADLDYNTDTDLNIMINLAKELIKNKKYL